MENFIGYQEMINETIEKIFQKKFIHFEKDKDEDIYSIWQIIPKLGKCVTVINWHRNMTRISIYAGSFFHSFTNHNLVTEYRKIYDGPIPYSEVEQGPSMIFLEQLLSNWEQIK